MRNRSIVKNNNIDSALFTFQCINRGEREHIDGLKQLHRNIRKIMSRNSDVDCAVESLSKEIEGCKYINALNKYGYKTVLTKGEYSDIKNKAERFFKMLNQLPKKEKKLFIRDDFYTISAFLVAVGIKPSCIISDEMSSILKRGELFKNTSYIEYGNGLSHSLGLMHVFYPEKMLKVINKNNDIFPKIKDTNNLMEYLKQNPVKMHASSIRSNRGKYYQEQLSTGILLGIPKTEAIKFAAFQPYINDFIGYLFYGSFDGILQEPKDYKEFEILTKDRTNRLRRYDIPPAAINLLARMGTVRVEEDIREFAYYRFGFEPINRFYTKQIRQILSYTDYHKNIKQLG